MDEERRRLERAVAERDPRACVRYAELLERAGRRAEAARVLRSVIESAAAREALANYPAWTHERADAGASGSLDVEPVTRTPRLLWKRSLFGRKAARDAPRILAAGPLGVVPMTRDGFSVVEPDDGAVRFSWRASSALRRERREFKGWNPGVALDGDSLAVWNDGRLWRFRLGKGEVVGARELSRTRWTLVTGHVIYCPQGRSHFAAYDLEGGDGTPLWRVPVGDVEMCLSVRATDELVLLVLATGVRALARDSGQLVWQSRAAHNALLADRAGAVQPEQDLPQRPDEAWLAVLDTRGRAIRRVDGRFVPRALGPTFVVVATDVGERARVVDRATGALRELRLHRGWSGAMAIARDVIVGPIADEGALHLGACGREDELLWEVDLAELLSVKRIEGWSLALLDRTIYLLLDDGTLAALTDLPEA